MSGCFSCFKQSRQPKYKQQEKKQDKHGHQPILDRPEQEKERQLVVAQEPTKLIPSPKHESQIHSKQAPKRQTTQQKKPLKPQEVLWNHQYSPNSATILCQQDVIANKGFTNNNFNKIKQKQLLFNDQIFRLFKDKHLVKEGFPDPLVKYKMLSIMNQKQALDVTSVTDSSKGLRKGDLIIWQYHGGPNQGFYIKHLQGEKVKIINAATGYPIKVKDGSRSDGATMKVNPELYGENQVFELVPHEIDAQDSTQNVFQIVTFCDKALDVKGRSTSNGTQVVQWKRNQQKNQLWLIIPA